MGIIFTKDYSLEKGKKFDFFIVDKSLYDVDHFHRTFVE
jgi:hypothetical protein